MKDRIEGWLGGTYRIFQKPKDYLNYFKNLNQQTKRMQTLSLEDILQRQIKLEQQLLILIARNIMKKQNF